MENKTIKILTIFISIFIFLMFLNNVHAKNKKEFDHIGNFNFRSIEVNNSNNSNMMTTKTSKMTNTNLTKNNLKEVKNENKENNFFIKILEFFYRLFHIKR